MTSLQSQENYEANPWNPFEPTERDVERTEKLAKKNPVVAGLLTLFFLPAAMIYLNRGINPLKIFGYAFILGVTIAGFTSKSEEEAFQQGRTVGTIANIVIMAENINTITQARKRKRKKG